MLLYALTIFLSAFLLFLVQPLIARIILPWFGGTAPVWTTCMMFFQAVLLGGYFYSHAVIRRLRPRSQALLHIGLLASSVLLLPILPGSQWKPADSLHPEVRILVLLAATVGIPYLLLSTTGPLIQAWFAREHPGASAYRLYSLSNAGSLIALLGYPLLIEPSLRIATQAWTWSAIYVGFVLLCGATAYRVLRNSAEGPAQPAAQGPLPALSRMAVWTTLAFCPSALLVGITSHLTQNIAPVPLLWVVPLALYLVSFILTFESERWYSRRVWFPLFIASIGLMTAFFFPDTASLGVRLGVPVFTAAFFCCAMTCHGELYRLRPEPSQLTTFYLMLSFGGALGGLFVGVIAPAVFNNYYEVPVAMLVSVLAVGIVTREGDVALWGPRARAVQYGLLGCAAAGLLYLTAWALPAWGGQYQFLQRNFYGILRIEDTARTEDSPAVRDLFHGTVHHGSEIMEPGRRREPTTYYGHNSGIGVTLLRLAAHPLRVGVIGLGAGTISAYCRPGDVYRFYDINPMVVDLAQHQFFYLQDCPAQHDIVLGDARLSLERAAPENFDVLAVDAFSGSTIPVHLLTVEAFQEFLRHIKPDGILAVHISNRFLNLKRVVSREAGELHLNAILISDDGKGDEISYSDWALISRDPNRFTGSDWKVKGREDLGKGDVLWTDDYSSVLTVLK